MTTQLKPFDQMAYDPVTEMLTDIMCAKTQNSERMFFRIACTYYWGVLASQMHANIQGWGGNTLPINIYAMNLSPSGTGKGYSTGLIERSVIDRFRESFMENTFPLAAEQNMQKLANSRATRKGSDPHDELAGLTKEFNSIGSLLFSFDSATVPAVKQLRHKLNLAKAGGVNLQIDEIGANLVGQEEVTNAFLELYDTGMIKDKLVKSSAENTRFERIEGATPTNMLLFGTPSKLLDSGATQRHLIDMLEMGYARRCFFGYTAKVKKNVAADATELVNQMFNSSNDAQLDTLSCGLEQLADISNLNKVVRIEQAEAVYLMEYKINCDRRAEQLKDHENILRSELENRFFKVLKLAAAYAFRDYSPNIRISHLESAMKLAEDSGRDFTRLMQPEFDYEKVAKYLADCGNNITLPDLEQALPCFRGSKQQKDQMLEYAVAWAYKNNIIIKKLYDGNILFLRGESLKRTNVDELIISTSDKLAEGYEKQRIKFDDLERLGKVNGFHWANHHFDGGYRREDHTIPGFNTIVLDVDGTLPLSTAKELMKDYKAFFYTTKRHQDEDGLDRYRIVLPTNYILELDREEYKMFMDNVMSALPFDMDESCNQRNKKWLTCDSVEVHMNEGELFDVLPFIPRTSKNEEREAKFKDQKELDNLERWVLNNTGDGNRNKQLYNYAMVLVESGHQFTDIGIKVRSLNDKLADKLSADELQATILKSIQNKANKV
ncbi:DNA primase [Acinetobacter phage nACB1]|nr:DNA primase [Acinetobacter phage nACB1]